MKYSCVMTAYCSMGVVIQKGELTTASFAQLQAYMETYSKPWQGKHPAARVVFSVTLPCEEKPKTEIILVLEEINTDLKQSSYARRDAFDLKREIESIQSGSIGDAMLVNRLRNDLLTKTHNLSARQLQALYNLIA